MIVWTLEAGTSFEGNRLAGVYGSAVKALDAIVDSRSRYDECLAMDGYDEALYDAGWLIRHDYIVLTEVRMGETQAWHETPRTWESVGRGHHSWRSESGGSWSGTAAELLALVTP